MYYKICCFLLIGFVSIEQQTEAFVINPFEIFSKPFGSLTNSLFNWNPFQNVAELNFEDETEYLEDTIDADRNVTEVKRNYYYGCKCIDYVCSCCAHVEVNRLKLNNTGCLNMTYSNMDDIQLLFDLDGKVYYNNSISIVNPPDLCFGTPFVDLAKLCLKFYELDARNKTFSGSVDLIAKLDGKQVARIKLGSFHFGNGSRYESLNLMSYFFNNKNLKYSYGNLTDRIKNISQASKNLAAETYHSLVNKFEKIDLPQVSFDFQPEKFMSNLYKSLFFPRINKNKNSQKNDTVSSSSEEVLIE